MMMTTEDLALIVLPAFIFYASVCLIAHAAISKLWRTQPAFYGLLVFISIRCLIYLQGNWPLNTAVTLVLFPVALLLVAEESIRSCYSGIGDIAPRRALYWRCISIGVMISAIAWSASGPSTYPGAPRWAFIWRILVDACALGMLAMCFSDILALKRQRWVDKHILRRQGILALYVGGAFLSSGIVDVSGWWNATLLTECIQLPCLLVLHATIPFKFGSPVYALWPLESAPLASQPLSLHS